MQEMDRWIALRSAVCAALQRGDGTTAGALLQAAIGTAAPACPNGLDEAIWTELLLNACSSGDDRLPACRLVESRSLPRSGHHYLQRLLQQAFGSRFSYCEGQLEPGCCKASPCRMTAHWHYARRHHVPHLRLIKSHDLGLRDPTFAPPPGMLRLIQVRRPLPLLASWLELDQLVVNRKLLLQAQLHPDRIFLHHEKALLEQAWWLIDRSGTVMQPEQLQMRLNRKITYTIRFLRKWLPLTRPFPFGGRLENGNYLLLYEQLNRSRALLEALGVALGVAPAHHGAEAFSPRSADVLERASSRVTALLRASEEQLHHAEAQILRNVPALRELYG